MSSSEKETVKETVKVLVNKMAEQGLHDTICKCSMCMQAKKLSPIELSIHKEELKSTMVKRSNPDNPDEPLMRAEEVHAIIQTGTKVSMRDKTGIRPNSFSENIPQLRILPELTVPATWKPSHVERAVSGKDASVFGSLGVLLIPEDISVVNIPKMDARAVPAGFLSKYGAKLIPIDEPVELEDVDDPSLKNLYLVEYYFDKDYVEQYVMKSMGGGGLFVETHPFPHLFTPLSKDCSGALILGVQNSGNTFSFVSFEIPFGYTMKVNSNVIHGDSFFIGPYAIALTETELADSVLFRRDVNERTIQNVTQTRDVQLPILAEYRLAKAVNHALLIELTMNPGKEFKGQEFLSKQPQDVLNALQNASRQSKENIFPKQRINYHAFFKAPRIENSESSPSPQNNGTKSEPKIKPIL